MQVGAADTTSFDLYECLVRFVGWKMNISGQLQLDGWNGARNGGPQLVTGLPSARAAIAFAHVGSEMRSEASLESEAN